MTTQKEILIIGGGVIGLCTAYSLTQRGHSVRVLDKSTMQDGCSYGNAGMIVPSHFIPLAAPGMVMQGIRWMFNSRSPFYIKPRLSRDLIAWGWNFYRAATESHVNRSMPVLRDLNLQSRNLYAQMARIDAFAFAFETKGLHMLCKTDKMLEEEAHVAHTAQELGIEARVLNRAEVHGLEPEVLPDVTGSVLYPGDAHLHPNMLVSGLKKYLLEKGVRIDAETEVTSFVTTKNTITEVVTSKGRMKADEVILAGGAWSQDIARMLSLNLPIQAGKGYSITLPEPDKRLRIPTILTEARVAMTPMHRQLRIGGTMEIGGINQTINQNRLQGILQAVGQYIPDYQIAIPPSSQVWSGLRPCSPDGLPYIGRLQKYQNMVVASGHSMMGLSLAPITGKLVDEIIANEKPSVSLNLLSPERFK